MNILFSPLLKDKEQIYSTGRVAEDQEIRLDDNSAFDLSFDNLNRSDLFQPVASSSTSFPRSPVAATVNTSSPVAATMNTSSPVASTVNTSLPRALVATTVHEQPDWLQQLKDNFSQEIISPCSAITRSAVEKNMYIQVH